jgi:predicted aspartyl protease
MNKNIQRRSFTVKAQGVLSAIITPCKVCQAFDPFLRPEKIPKINTYNALWDTGATGTVINKKVVDELGLKPVGIAKVNHANGESMVNTYMVNVILPNDMGIHSIKVTDGILSGFDLLIGMNVISKGDFSICNKDGMTIFSFQMPSTHDIDFVEEDKKNNHTPIIKDKLPGRNDPCHCGSGNKYKNCHGR